MPLEPPQLDDRKFEDLLDEARLRLQRYCPEWTDFNDSDPGMALVQLFAWLTEMMIYRMNQVPDLNRITFLKLLNLQRRPARPASTQVVLSMTPSNPPRPQTIPARARFFVPGDTQQLVFESTTAIDLVPYPLNAVQVFDGLKYHDFSTANQDETRAFSPLGLSPQVGNALYLGFQAEEPVEGKPYNPVSAFPNQVVLYFFTPPPTTTATRLVAARDGGQKLPRLVWEYQSKLDGPKPASEGETGPSHPPPDRWRPLTVVDDGTRSLTREGRIALRGPGPDCDWNSEPKGQDDKARFWIRCRLARGTYTQGSVPQIAFVRCNVVEVENRATYSNEFLGEGDGRRNEFPLKNHPVDPESLEIVVTTGTGESDTPWTLQTDLGKSRRDDRHFMFDENSGVVQFGDGKHGQIPIAGEFVIARTYRAGGGATGNIRAGTIKDPPAVSVAMDSVTNPRAAVGGQDEEPLADLFERAPRVLRGDRRAITADDYKRHAEEESGVGRAVVLPLSLPQHPGLKIPGAVTVVVIPRAASPRAPDDPIKYLPPQELLDLVEIRLEECRPTTAEVVVAAPRYRDMTISVKITGKTGITENQARNGVRQAIEDYFCPNSLDAGLTPIGRKPVPPQWEVGTPIHPSRLYEVILNARDPESDKLLVQDVSQLVVELERQTVAIGQPLTLDPDELPACRVVVEVLADDQPRRPA